MNTTKTIVALAALIFAGNIQAQTVSFSADDVNIKPGDTAELVISLENSMEIAAWQISLYLPDNVFVAYEEEDGEKYYDYSVTKSSRHTRSHKAEIQEKADGGYLITCYASPTKAINGTSGELVTIILQANDSFRGQGVGTIQGAVSTVASVQTKAEDATFNISSTTSITEVNADGMQADGKYYKNGEIIIKKGNKEYNAVGAIKK